MAIMINGKPHPCAETQTLAQVLLSFAPDLAQRTGGVAVAVNGDIVPRADWDSHVLNEDDRVEIVTAFAGG